MINSVNALEFLKPKLLTMDKYNSTTTTKLLPTSLTQTRTFTTVSGHQNINTIDNLQQRQTQFLLNDTTKDQDRVTVQHLENHTKLQNNKCWNNFRTLYNISASPNFSDREMFQLHQTKDDKEILDVVNVENFTSTTTIKPLNTQSKSALNLDLNNKYQMNNSGLGGNDIYIDNKKKTKSTETNNNYNFYCKQYNNYGLINKQSLTTAMLVMSTEPQIAATNDSQLTEDQNNAYRHIESVHNYAKSKTLEGDDDDKVSPSGSGHSSYLDDDDDDDDDEEDNDDGEYDNEDDIEYEDGLRADLDADYEDIFSKRRFHKHSTLSDGALSNETLKMGNNVPKQLDNFTNILKDHKLQALNQKKSPEDEEIHVDIDVETVEQLSASASILKRTSSNEMNGISEEPGAILKPDHHARRPMNAFLIFCKRHRAIVKERYKNLENRAITKILGDWWASLDTNDKTCFTSLAQQNKDAFFSANPNFKWYKLPAPPLRSLTTRPSNTFGQECQEDNEVNALDITRYSHNHSNYFKLADVAQMGDLSQLMLDKSKTSKQSVDLQQVLGEASQFLSAHITGDSEAVEENHLKRRFYNENSLSSHSSEEDIMEPAKKSVRSCKGKRYQELINSGQIATCIKKSKPLTRSFGADGVVYSNTNIKQNFTNVNDFNSLNNNNNNACQQRSLSEADNMPYDINSFDLEEKIKQLPALSLDDYLQRKRNTKKKKKFSSNGKKRGQRTGLVNNNDNRNVTISQETEVMAATNEQLQQQQELRKQHQQTAAAVGSQKRKARKESITRRDVSTIEQEVASLLPLTINGCCYFQEAPTIIKYKKPNEKDIETSSTASQQSFNVTSISPIIPFIENSSSVSVEILNTTNLSNNISNDNMSTSTSDLLILAEVAANRTELKR